MLAFLFDISAMDLPVYNPETTIVRRMHSAQQNGDSPLSWRNINELKHLREDIRIYLRINGEHEDTYRSLITMLRAAEETNKDRDSKALKLTPMSRAKIVSGGVCIGISCLQAALLVKSWATGSCMDGFTSLENLLSIISSASGGVYLVYDGISNTDAQLESAEAAKTELLLLQNYVRLKKNRRVHFSEGEKE